MTAPALHVLQFCHGYDGPFLDCARQYASLFVGTPYKVTTVYLTGEPNPDVVAGSASDEVVFLGYKSEEVSGLKLNAILAFKKVAASHNFRFCITHRSKPTYVALLATVLPVIAVHHAFGDFQRFSRKLFVRFFRERLTLLGVSDAVCDDMRACLPNWPHDRVLTLYNRLDVAAVQAELLSREDARQALALPQDAWVVGNVGRLHPDKDQATLIRGFAAALPQLPAGSLLVIMGAGRLEQQLKSLVANLRAEEQVLFLGQVPNARRYFKAFDVFTLSSGREGLGMVLLEAMAAMVPLIATDCGGQREVVQGVGELFRFGDHAALAELLKAQSQRQDDALEITHQRMMEKLHGCFSDSAGRQVFWTYFGMQ